MADVCHHATAFDGLCYLGLSFFLYGLKIGYAWHDAGPIMGFPIVLNGYLNMILATYAMCGVYLLRVAKDVSRNTRCSSQ